MKRILLVDDNRLDRRLIMHLLKQNFQNRISIDEASDGMIAFEMITNTNYDLIITDLIMPKIEGMELIKKIRNKTPFLPVIAVSGSNPYYLVMAKKMGTYSAFTKPLNSYKFLSSVKSVFDTQVKINSI